jgi:hypothetical protein
METGSSRPGSGFESLIWPASTSLDERLASCWGFVGGESPLEAPAQIGQLLQVGV